MSGLDVTEDVKPFIQGHDEAGNQFLIEASHPGGESTGAGITLTDINGFEILLDTHTDSHIETSGQFYMKTNGGGPANLDTGNVTDSRNFSFPNESDTLSLLEANQSWTGSNTFNMGPAATTTVSFGQIGSTTSRVCFNANIQTGMTYPFILSVRRW